MTRKIIDKKYQEAFIAHRRSGDKLANAKRRLDDLHDRVFQARLYYEECLADYTKTSRKLSEFDK